MSVGIGLEGVDAVLEKLEHFVERLEEAAADAMSEQGDRLVDDVQDNTPKVTGAARDSVRVTRATSQFVEVRAGGKGAPYFTLIEWGGTHDQHPTAPFRRALEVRRLVLVNETRASIRRSVPELK